MLTFKQDGATSKEVTAEGDFLADVSADAFGAIYIEKKVAGEFRRYPSHTFDANAAVEVSANSGDIYRVVTEGTTNAVVELKFYAKRR